MKLSQIVVWIVLIAFIILGVWTEMIRWHMFQQVTHSNISYWEWQFLFGNHK